MKFWDSSALVPLLLEEASSPRMRALAEADPHLMVWWGSEVECASALARAESEQRLERKAEANAAFRDLSAFARAWRIIEPAPGIKGMAVRLLRVHALRAGDALQLAAALVACGQQPPTLEFVTLDERLAQAAEREGFPLV